MEWRLSVYLKRGATLIGLKTKTNPVSQSEKLFSVDKQWALMPRFNYKFSSSCCLTKLASNLSKCWVRDFFRPLFWIPEMGKCLVFWVRQFSDWVRPKILSYAEKLTWVGQKSGLELGSKWTKKSLVEFMLNYWVIQISGIDFVDFFALKLGLSLCRMKIFMQPWAEPSLKVWAKNDIS